MSVRLASLTKHALVAGSTGSGKTTTVLELLRQLWVDHHVPFLVIEPVNSDADDYRRLLVGAGLRDARGCHRRRRLRRAAAIQPVRGSVNTHRRRAHGEPARLLQGGIRALGAAALHLPGRAQPHLPASRDPRLRAGGRAVERRWPTAVEFMRAMREATQELGYAGEVKSNIEAASIRRAQQMAAGVTASTFLTDQPNDIGRLLDHPVILELKSLGSGDEQALMIALLLNAMTEHYQSVRGASPELAHVTVIEEAHRLLARPAGGEGRREGAGEGEGSRGVREHAGREPQVRRRHHHRRADPGEARRGRGQEHRSEDHAPTHRRGGPPLPRRIMGLDETQMRFTTRLQTGEALVYSDEFSESTHLQVPRTIAGSAPVLAPSSAPPFSACDRCRAKCSYRGAALAIARDAAVVRQFEQLVGRLQKSGRPPQDVTRDWNELIDGLRERVRSFHALPSEGKGLDDAAYCLFLHTLAVRTMKFSAAWPKAVARRLGIPEA